jgi:hypothetical protein
MVFSHAVLWAGMRTVAFCGHTVLHYHCHWRGPLTSPSRHISPRVSVSQDFVS